MPRNVYEVDNRCLLEARPAYTVGDPTQGLDGGGRGRALVWMFEFQQPL